MTSTTTPTSEVLYAAADHVAKFGLHKGSTWAGPINESAACTVAAIQCGARIVSGFDWPMSGELARDALRDYLRLDGDLGQCIATWSDAPERTTTEVTEVLRATAVIEAAKEQAASDLADALDVAPVGVRA